MHRFLLVGAIFALSATPSTAQRSPSTGQAPDTNPAAVVRAYVEAFNLKNIDAVIGHLAEDFVWLTVAGDSVVVEARGRSAVQAQLTDYFRTLPSARSVLEEVSVLGPWVSAHERAHWTGRSGPTSQASISVYEVRGGLIRRVWYYPVVR